MTIKSTWMSHGSDVGVNNDNNTASISSPSQLSLPEQPPKQTPDWIVGLQNNWGEKLIVYEFDEVNDDEVQQDNPSNNVDYRSKNGWNGRDLIHDRNSPVQITSYYVQCK
jgi:hypothetical protein